MTKESERFYDEKYEGFSTRVEIWMSNSPDDGEWTSSMDFTYGYAGMNLWLFRYGYNQKLLNGISIYGSYIETVPSIMENNGPWGFIYEEYLMPSCCRSEIDSCAQEICEFAESANIGVIGDDLFPFR